MEENTRCAQDIEKAGLHCPFMFLLACFWIQALSQNCYRPTLESLKDNPSEDIAWRMIFQSKDYKLNMITKSQDSHTNLSSLLS